MVEQGMGQSIRAATLAATLADARPSVPARQLASFEAELLSWTKHEAEADSKSEAEAVAKREAEADAKREAEAGPKLEAEAKARREAEVRAKLEREKRLGTLRRLTPPERKRLREVFDEMDTDGSDELDYVELKQALVTHGIKLSLKELKHVYTQSDKDASSAIDFDEFCDAVESIPATLVDRQASMKALQAKLTRAAKDPLVEDTTDGKGEGGVAKTPN